ncbi:hypothetical protein DWX12_10280, partial [Bifidobacterium pseudocatenulatum]
MSLIIQTVFSNLIDWLFKPLDSLCSNILAGAFSGMVGSMSNDEWNIAITVANRIGWIMGFVNMALCIIAALQGAVKGSVADVLKSFAMAVLAWPLTAVSVSVMITLDGIVGRITNRILTIPLDGEGTAGDPFGDSVVSNLISSTVKVTGGFDLIIRIVMYLAVFIATLALAGMLAARDITLILLAGIAPLPIMMAGWKTTRPAAAKWVSSVVGVLLFAPLSALVIMVGSALCYVAKTGDGWAESLFAALMGVATLFMACFSPKLIMPAVSFVGNNITADMQARGGKVGPNAIKAAVQVTASVVSAATGVATGGAGLAANTAATGVATGGAGLAANTAAKGVLGAAQGRPADVGGAIGQLFSKGHGQDASSETDAKTGQAAQSSGSNPSGSASAPSISTPAVSGATDGMDHTGSSQVMDSASDAGHTGSDAASVPAPVAPASSTASAQSM